MKYELYHYGVKGMRWGVRHDKVTDSDIRRKREELIRQAPSNNGERRPTSAPPTKDYWENAPNSQIRRMVENDQKAKRKLERQVGKYTNRAKEKADYMRNLGESIREHGDWEDDEYFRTLPKQAQEAEWARSKKVAAQYLKNADYWDKAANSISKAKNKKEAQNLYKKYWHMAPEW